jgi:hypothetical protein
MQNFEDMCCLHGQGESYVSVDSEKFGENNYMGSQNCGKGGDRSCSKPRETMKW